MSLTAPEQPEPGQDPQATPEPQAPAATAPATPPAPAGNTPWVNDLNALFPDDATRGEVDKFLREKIQPYTTKLEQQAAQTQDAARLWNDLTDKPIDTYVAITEELFGAQAAQQLLAQLQQQIQAEQAAQQPGAPAAPAPVNDPRLEAVIQYVESQQTSAYYDAEIAKIAADPQYSDVNTDLLHPFVAATDGDFAQAIEIYRKTAQGFQPVIPEPGATETAPAVLGSDSATAPAPPVIPQKQSLNEAIDDFMRETRPSPAPPVGTA